MVERDARLSTGTAEHDVARVLFNALQGLMVAYGATDGRNGNSGKCWDDARAAVDLYRCGAPAQQTLWRTDFENAPSPCIGWCAPSAGDEVRQIWRHPYIKGGWSAHGAQQNVKAWQPLPPFSSTECPPPSTKAKP